MSTIKAKNIKQTVIGTTTQPLKLGGIRVNVDEIVVDGYYRKWINGYENRYSIDKDSNVYSHWFKQSKKALLLTKTIDKNGYVKVTLSKNNHGKSKTVHRLMAQTFIHNEKNKPTVNHKNGIKTDNRLENLEWATYSENSIHAFKNGLNRYNINRVYSEESKRSIGERRSLFTLNEADDIMLYIEQYNVSPTKMSKIIGCDKEVILNMVRGTTKYYKKENAL